MMVIGLVDQITKPLQGITTEINGAMSAAEKGMEQAAKGGAGLWATGVAIQNALMPAIEINRKIGEVKSLNVAADTLEHLKIQRWIFQANTVSQPLNLSGRLTIFNLLSQG